MSTTVYTYNDRLVGVGNDQILGTSQGGGSTYTAGNGIDITNDVISVDDTVAMASALPTTELGKFTIQSNVSGGPIEVRIPIDQGHAVYTVLMDSDSVSGTYEISGGWEGVLFKSPGYDNDYWDYSAGTVTMHVPEAITGIATIYACYASNSNPTGSYGSGPSFFSNYPWSNPDTSTYTLLPGDYEIATKANQVPQSAGGYGKYISVVANGPGPDINALSKISFAGIERHPELGYDVNLDRYALGNTNSISSTSGYPEACIYKDPTTKKQSVYLPYSMPTSWTPNDNIIQSFQYGNNYGSPSSSNYNTKQYRAYKYTSSPRRYQFAYCTDWDDANKLMTFVAYDNSGNAIEKWTLDYTTYGSNVWTTTPISSGGTEYTAGDYISIENDEIAVTGVGNLVAGNNITITESGNNITISSEGGGSTYTAGQYISIDNDEIAVTGLAPVSGSDGIAVNNNVVSLDTPVEIVAGDNITISVTGASAIISAQTDGVTETQLYDATVTAVQAATGAIPTFTEGNCIDITSNAISWETSAGITDIVSVTALPANPVATVIYLIPET